MNVVLSEMAEQVRRRRLMMYTYFKDYDRVNKSLNIKKTHIKLNKKCLLTYSIEKI